MHVKGDVEGTRFVNKDSKAATVMDIELKGLKLDVRITATAVTTVGTGADKTYKSWETAEDAKWTKTTTSEGVNYSLALSKFTGTVTTMKFVTSRMSPPDYKPAKDLGHSITQEIKVKFFSKS